MRTFRRRDCAATGPCARATISGRATPPLRQGPGVAVQSGSGVSIHYELSGLAPYFAPFPNGPQLRHYPMLPSDMCNQLNFGERPTVDPEPDSTLIKVNTTTLHFETNSTDTHG